jgi:uncharacterized protein YdaT
MKPKSEKSIELYNMMLHRGYPEPDHAEEGTGERQCTLE